MLNRKEYMPLGYFQKQPWTGSFQGMRFCIRRVTESSQDEQTKEEKTQDYLEAIYWKEPFSFERTPESEKTYRRFPLSEEGRMAAIEWLEAEYEADAEGFRQARKWNWDKENS